MRTDPKAPWVPHGPWCPRARQVEAGASPGALGGHAGAQGVPWDPRHIFLNVFLYFGYGEKNFLLLEISS